MTSGAFSSDMAALTAHFPICFRDLEKLFCPLTDSHGAPYDILDKGGPLPVGPTGGEALSASSCRRVQSEILASVSRIKSSILGRKGGFLHSYNLLESQSNSSINSTLSVSGSGTGGTGNSADATPIKVTPPTPTLPTKMRTSKSHGSFKRNKSPLPGTGTSQQAHPNAITVSLPSPAGNRKLTDTPTKGTGSGGGSGKTGGGKANLKKWDKVSKVRKAMKGEQTPPQRGRIGSNSSIKLNEGEPIFSSGPKRAFFRNLG